MAEETNSVRITQNAIYAKQLEHGETLIKILQKLDNLETVPDRLREVELTLARLAWVERIAYTALSAALIGLISAVMSLVLK
jgi:hypothetical protein